MPEKRGITIVTGEVQTLERQLEVEESRYRQLEESHNRSEHERSQHELSQNEMRQKERQAQDEVRRLQQELEAKDDLVRPLGGWVLLSQICGLKTVPFVSNWGLEAKGDLVRPMGGFASLSPVRNWRPRMTW